MNTLQKATSNTACLLRQSCDWFRMLQLNQSRTGVVMTRMYEPRLRKMNIKSEKLKKLKKREHVYIVKDHTDSYKVPNIDIILTREIEGLGKEGETISIKANVVRNKLVPAGVAVYASPENLAKYLDKSKEISERLPLSLQKTLDQLEFMNLKIPMSNENPWVLNKSHVRISFRRNGVVVPDHAITMPAEQITEPTETKIKVTINGKHERIVNTIVYHHTEDKEVLHAMPHTFKRIRKSLSEILANAGL